MNLDHLQALYDQRQAAGKGRVSATMDDMAFLLRLASHPYDGEVTHPVKMHDSTCTCPSGDGSLRWPCSIHPTARVPAYGNEQERVPIQASSAALPIDDTARLDWLEARCNDLRSVSLPIPGGDDADVGWQIIEHHMAAPVEREVGFGMSVRKAIDNARAALSASAEKGEA